MHWVLIILFAGLVAVLQPAANGLKQPKSIQISHTGNMGVLVKGKNATWWFDGLHAFYREQYQHLPDSLLQLALAKKAPFDQLDGLMVSHFHRDHYSASLTKELITHSNKLIVSGSNQVGDSLPATNFLNGWNKNGIIHSDPQTGLRIESYNLAHTGSVRHREVQNIMYSLLINGVRITHVGDADEKSEELKRPAFINADVLIVPVWFITSGAAISLLKITKAHTIIVTHISPGQKVDCNIGLKADVILFDQVGERLDL